MFFQLLQEVIDNKQFESVEDLVKAVKSVLRKASFPRYKENKVNSDKGFAAPSQYGYKYKYLNSIITISFFGAERSWVSELARALKTVEINFHFNEKQDIFLIKSLDNVKPLDIMNGDSVEEYEKGTFGVIGTIVDSKHDIKDAIDDFDPAQRRIYFELVQNDMVEWSMIKIHVGRDSVKFKYKLVAIKIETDK